MNAPIAKIGLSPISIFSTRSKQKRRKTLSLAIASKHSVKADTVSATVQIRDAKKNANASDVRTNTANMSQVEVV